MYLIIVDKVIDKLIAWLMKDSDPVQFPLSDFDRMRYEVNPGDVLLVEGRSRISELIQLTTQSPWSHAMLYIGRIHDIDNRLLRERVREHYDGEDQEQLVVESLLGRGTIVAPLAEYKQDHMRICRPRGISHQDCQRVIGYCIGRLGVDYDVRQIIDLARFLFPWSIVPRRWRSSLFNYNPSAPLREICSTLIAEAFDSIDFPILPLIKEHEETGIELIPRNPRLFTPKDFDYSPFFQIIKYPIFDMSLAGSLYRNLPWNRNGNYSNDDGSIYSQQPQQVPTPTAEKTPAHTPQKINLLEENDITNDNSSDDNINVKTIINKTPSNDDDDNNSQASAN